MKMTMMKMVRWALAVSTMSVLTVGCAVGAEPDDESDEADTPALETQSTGLTRTTLYYAGPRGHSVVGGCTFSSCPPKGTTCWGEQTAYYDVFTTACF